ncbi:hypothetical protein BSLA_01f5065 [Burkholderia stabilis]|nr:hypothetical protein BSLA_01f5065 [Burkholderia stabilis]
MFVIFSVNIDVFHRCRRFNTTWVSNEIDWLPAKNRRTECGTQNLHTAKNIHYCCIYWGSIDLITGTNLLESRTTN